MDANCWEVNGEPAVQLNTTLDGIDQLGNIGVTWVEARVRIDDANDGA